MRGSSLQKRVTSVAVALAIASVSATAMADRSGFAGGHVWQGGSGNWHGQSWHGQPMHPAFQPGQRFSSVPAPRATVPAPRQQIPTAPHRVNNFTSPQFSPVPPKVAHAFNQQHVTTLPPNHQVFFRGSDRFFFARGHWFRPVNGHFVTVLPPPGFVVRTLPVVHAVFWVGAVPYYYANFVYYTPVPQGYVVTQPPAEITEQPVPGVIEQPPSGATSRVPGDQLFIYPRQGQTPEQQSRDRRECNEWAIGQTGYDPNVAAGDTTSDSEQLADKFAGYQRAMGACLDGRGYTVR